MREIKFRGYAVEEMVGSQWLYGFGVSAIEYAEHFAKEIGREKDWYLYTDNGAVHVHEKSVGQYTGLKDKNDKEIYEGDEVEFNDFDSLRTGGHTEDNILQGEVSFSCGAWIVITERGHYDLYNALVNDEEFEVIGNICENPELINS